MLQTLSLLIQNIKSPIAVYYLFSNNYLNEIVCLHFDFSNDEVLGYYINLLKAISMKFDQSTIQFFFQASSACAPLLQHLEQYAFKPSHMHHAGGEGPRRVPSIHRGHQAVASP